MRRVHDLRVELHAEEAARRVLEGRDGADGEPATSGAPAARTTESRWLIQGLLGRQPVEELRRVTRF